MLGLPDRIRACLFDLDGVLTQTATVHRAAWTRALGAFLHGAHPDQRPFSADDYRRYVDGKPRADGVRDFLASRGIVLPEGSPADPPEAVTVHGLARRKDELFVRELRKHGVVVYPDALRYLRAVKDAGLVTAVVTASVHGAEVLAAGGLYPLVDVRIDGIVAAHDGLRGKPAPDTFLAAAHRLGVPPAQAAVFEDALAGVAAGRAGGFGYVVGVNRAGNAPELEAQGADVVISDLAQLLHTQP